MTGHVTLCWSTYFLGDISARNRRFLAEKSARNHCSVNRADFSPISRREIGDFSPRNHCNVNRAKSAESGTMLFQVIFLVFFSEKSLFIDVVSNAAFSLYVG